jgi:hypothetical protein
MIVSCRTSLLLALLLAALVVTASPSSAGVDSASRRLRVESAAASLSDPTEAGLRAAATAFANAFLHGTLRDVFKVLDPTCVPKLRSRLALGNAELQGFRRLVKHYTGIDAADIKVRNVEVSNYDVRTGDAETHYGLPTAVEGNDNWNTYAFSHGRWHIAGCAIVLPMLGHGSSSGPDAPTST